MNRTFQDNTSNYHTYSALKCNAHYDMAEMYKRRHRRYGLVVVLFSSIVSTSVFATFVSEPEGVTQLLTGLLSVAAVVLSALQTFFAFADLQAQYKASASGYGACRRNLEMLVMKFPDATGFAGEPATIELEKIKETLDQLDKESPTLPERLWRAVVKRNNPTEHAPASTSAA